MENFPTLWMTDICDALNDLGLEMPKEKGGGKWSVDRFENSIQLMKDHVTYDLGIYTYLESKGLINRGKCPITGETIGKEFCYQIFGRKVYISGEGIIIAKEWDKQQHRKIHGTEPLTDQELQDAKEQFAKTHKRRVPLMYWIILIVVIALIIKKCI